MEPTTPISLPWPEIVKLTIGAGLGTVVLNHLIEWLRDRSKATKLAKRDATYLSAGVVPVLEKFAIECLNQISDNDMYQKSNGTFGNPHRTLPMLGEYPSEVDWKDLEPTLLMRARSFRNEILLAEKVIEFMLDGDPDPSSWIEINPQTGKCGYQAWRLAADLRRRYKLSGFEPIERDSVELLKEYHDQELQWARRSCG